MITTELNDREAAAARWLLSVVDERDARERNQQAKGLDRGAMLIVGILAALVLRFIAVEVLALLRML